MCEYDNLWNYYHHERLDNLIRVHWEMDRKDRSETKPTVPKWLQGSSNQTDKICSVAKYLYTENYYSIRECALVVGKSESYVRKILRGERGGVYKPSLDKIDADSIARLETLNFIMSLENCEKVGPNMRYQYISLLAHLGYDYMQISSLFAGNQRWFIWRAMNRSNKAWKDLKTEALKLSQEKYNFLMQL